MIELGETVTWRAKHFGIWQELTSKVTACNYPTFFADEMVKGAFKSFRHEHYFSVEGEGTLMQDVFAFESPLGMLGRLFNWLVLKMYMKKLLIERNRVIKEEAEKNQDL